MQKETVFYGLLACSRNEVTGLDSEGEPCYFFSLEPVPSLDFFPLDLRPDLEPFRASLHGDRALGCSVSDFPQPIKCAIIPAAVCVAKARHFLQEKLPTIVADYDVIEEGGAVLYDIRANRTAIYAVSDPYIGFVRCVKCVWGESHARVQFA